ncbi:MAG TPA: gluconate:H+ symporter [Sphingomonas sp.]|jgi:GntP family gluconate:H+ symporter|nr:gluconate:H+ symporter [Sphingomonas sp.]
MPPGGGIDAGAVLLTGTPLVLCAIASVAVLIGLIAWVRVNPFIALVMVSLGLALAIGMPPAGVVKAFETGVGNTLGHLALVVALGTMLGKMMVESGGAVRIADTVIAAFGPKRVDWAMMTIAFLVGLPVFFEVGFVLLVPIVFTVARQTGTPLIKAGLPMAAGLSVVHGLVPPHPAALLAVTAYQADIGRTILYALIVGVPTAIIAGPVFARIVAPYVTSGTPAIPANEHGNAGTQHPLPSSRPGFGITLFTLLLPVGLMLLGSAADGLAAPGSAAHAALKFLGNSVVALLLAVLVSFWTFGLGRGFDRASILRFCDECLAPTAGITLVVGAGAGFGRILMDGGVSGAIIAGVGSIHLPILLLGWLVAALLRVATGSATVAMATASGIVAPLATAVAGTRSELLVLTTGAGSLVLSHVNDGGFWLVKQYFGLSIADTLKTWTVCETLISVLALCFTLLLSLALG